MQTKTTAQFARDLKAANGSAWKLVSSYTKGYESITLKCTSCGKERVVSQANNALHQMKCECQYNKTGPAPLTKNQVQASLDKLYGKNVYRLMDECNGLDKHSIKHKCGRVFEARLSNLLRKKPLARCPCEYRRVMTVTADMHREEVAAARGPDFELVNFVKGKQSQCTYRHVVCGKTFQTTRDSFNLSKGCPHCNPRGKERLTVDSIQATVNKVHGNTDYTVTKILDGVRAERIMIKHKCGHEYEGSARQLRDGLNRCTKCFGSKGGSTKEVKYRNHVFKCLGHEPITLRLILKHFKVNDIITSRDSRMIRINYEFNDGWRVYIPDFYVPSRNMLIEVKSPATLGLTIDSNAFFGEYLLERMQAKAQRCIKLGYDFRLFLYNNSGTRRIKLPRDWLEMDKYQLAKAVGIRM